MGSLFLTHKIKKKEEKVYPYFTYYNDGKKTRVFTRVVCNIKDWDKEKKRVKRSDKEYRLKNLSVDSIKTKLETIVNRYKNNDEILTSQQLKLELKKRELVKETTSLSTLPVYNLIEEWEKEYMKNEVLLKSTRTTTKRIVKDIKTFILEREKEYDTLLIDDLDEDFTRDFMMWLFNKPIKKGDLIIKGLTPHSVSRRFVYLHTFSKWYSRVTKEYIKIETPKELRKGMKISNDEDKPFLKNEELQKVYDFKGFDYYKPITKKGKVEWVESKDYEKHLKQKGDTKTTGKDGVVEFIYDKTKYGLQTYTTYEVYKDLFVFLCSVGCRYSDGVRMKLDNFYHGKRSKTSTLEGGVEGFFKFYQKKTNTESIPRVNEVSYEIYKKYSRGKKKGDYLFPLTENGNFIHDTKFNKHIKKICGIIGLKRPMRRRRLGNSGTEVKSVVKPLHEVISSHSGRYTYIYNMVIDGNYNTQELKRMTGHKTDKVFHGYYKLKEEIHKKPNTPFLKLHNNIISSDDKVKKIDIDTFQPPQKGLSQEEKLDKLKDDYKKGDIPKDLYEKLYEKLMIG
jgi:hypothetical protein